MKKTIKIDVALYRLSETNLDNLASEFCGSVAAMAGKSSSHDVIFHDHETDCVDPINNEKLTGTQNAALFQHALLCFKL